MKLKIFEPEYSICQLDPNETVPNWVDWQDEELVSISRTSEELTIIVKSSLIPTPPPTALKSQHKFACLRVFGELEFDVIGVIAGISTALANEKIPILSISTYNTDYFLIPKSDSDKAVSALTNAGYEFI